MNIKFGLDVIHINEIKSWKNCHDFILEWCDVISYFTDLVHFSIARGLFKNLSDTKMKYFAKTVNSFKPLTIFEKPSICDLNTLL